MASSNRIQKDNMGRMLIPMNVEGGTWEESFFSSTKIGILGALIAVDIIIGAWISGIAAGWVAKLLGYLFLVFISQLVIRKLILEENYYAQMYKKLQQFEITTPDIFWDITNIRETPDGGVLVYSDMKMGVIIRLERDTITGKNEQFKETHYDAISDFYKELNTHGLKFVQMNIMEQAGNDPRLTELDKLVQKSPNRNIAKLMEQEIGYIKSITRATLYESDYFLIYSDTFSKSDQLVSEAIDCVYKLLGGAFIGFEILDKRDVVDLIKEEYGVNYFDYAKATVNVFRNSGVQLSRAFNITGVKFTDGKWRDVDNVGNNRLNNLTSYISRGVIKNGEWTIRDTLDGKIKNNNEVEQGKGKRVFKQTTQVVSEYTDDAEVLINLDEDNLEVYDPTATIEGIANISPDIQADSPALTPKEKKALKKKEKREKGVGIRGKRRDKHNDLEQLDTSIQSQQMGVMPIEDREESTTDDEIIDF